MVLGLGFGFWNASNLLMASLRLRVVVDLTAPNKKGRKRLRKGTANSRLKGCLKRTKVCTKVHKGGKFGKKVASSYHYQWPTKHYLSIYEFTSVKFSWHMHMSQRPSHLPVRRRPLFLFLTTPRGRLGNTFLMPIWPNYTSKTIIVISVKQTKRWELECNLHEILGNNSISFT